MLTKTLLQIRKLVAKAAGVDGSSGDTASADLTADVLNGFINDALYESRDIMVGKWADYYTKSTPQAVIAGTDTYALPADLYKLRKLWILISGTRYERLYPMDLDIAHQYTGETVSGSRHRYMMLERNLVLTMPAANETLKIWYIPQPTDLAADVDTLTFDVPVELKLMVAMAWRDCLDRQKLDPSPAMAKIKQYSDQLRTAADSRDAGEPFLLDPRLQYADESDPEVD